MINDSGTCEMFYPKNFSKKSQDLPEAYQDAGQFYWTNLNINIVPSKILCLELIAYQLLFQDILFRTLILKKTGIGQKFYTKS